MMIYAMVSNSIAFLPKSSLDFHKAAPFFGSQVVTQPAVMSASAFTIVYLFHSSLNEEPFSALLERYFSNLALRTVF